MDEAQGIVLLALQRAGVELPKDLQSVGDLLHPQQLVPIYADTLRLLRGSAVPGLPNEFPQQMAERFRVCNDLVLAFQQLGYRDELSFHQFLYPSEADTHKLLRFLLDQLSQKSTTTPGGKGRRGRTSRVVADDFGGSKISGTVRTALTQCWDEANKDSGMLGDGKENRFGIQKSDSGRESKFGLQKTDSGFRVFEVVGGEEEGISYGVPFQTFPVRLFSARGATKKQPALITIQARKKGGYVFPSILEMNSRSAEKSGRLADAQLAHLARQTDTSLHRLEPGKKVISHGELLLEKEPANMSDTVGSSPPELAVERSHSVDAEGIQSEPPAAKEQAEISRLEEEFSSLTIQAEKLAGEKAAAEKKQAELQQKLTDSYGKAEELEQRRLLMKEALDLALDESSSPENVLHDLEVTVQEAQERLEILHMEWETVRIRLEERVEVVDKNAEARNSENQNKLKRMREMRQEVKEMTAKKFARETQEAQLTEDVAKMTKGASRATYVKRITELIRNSKKQDADIAHIIKDTRELQRESNTSLDKLRRLYAVVDELVFRDAKKDAVCKKAYLQLTTIHENFENIVAKVLEMDKMGREISELQAKVEDLEKRPVERAGVEADLEAIVAENRSRERELAEAAADGSPK